MKKKDRPWKFWVMIGLPFALGLVLLFVSHFIHEPWESFVVHLGTAAVVAAILGATIDVWFRQRLAKDVFEASVGYLLPEEFQAEMRNLYSQEFFCESHLQDILIEALDDQRVRVTSRIDRQIRNVSGTRQSVTLGGGVEEWFDDAEPSRITELGYRLGNRVELEADKIGMCSFAKGRPVVQAHSEKVSVRPDEIVVYWMTTVEIKPLSSEHHAHFTCATKNPRLNVRVRGPVEFASHFPREEPESKEQHSPGTFTFKGLIYPGQEIRVRWWPKAKADAWRATHSIEALR